MYLAERSLGPRRSNGSFTGWTVENRSGNGLVQWSTWSNQNRKYKKVFLCALAFEHRSTHSYRRDSNPPVPAGPLDQKIRLRKISDTWNSGLVHSGPTRASFWSNSGINPEFSRSIQLARKRSLWGIHADCLSRVRDGGHGARLQRRVAGNPVSGSVSVPFRRSGARCHTGYPINSHRFRSQRRPAPAGCASAGWAPSPNRDSRKVPFRILEGEKTPSGRAYPQDFKVGNLIAGIALTLVPGPRKNKNSSRGYVKHFSTKSRR